MCPENVKNMFGKCSGDGGIRGHVQRRGGTRPKVWGEGFDVRPPVRQGMDVQGNPPNSHRAMVTASPPCLTLALSEHRQSNSTHSPSQPRCFKCFRLFPKPELRLAGEFSNPAPSTHLMFAAHVRDPTRVTVASEKTWPQRKRTDLSPCYIVWRRMGWCGDVGVLRRTRFADFW